MGSAFLDRAAALAPPPRPVPEWGQELGDVGSLAALAHAPERGVEAWEEQRGGNGGIPDTGAAAPVRVSMGKGEGSGSWQSRGGSSRHGAGVGPRRRTGKQRRRR